MRKNNGALGAVVLFSMIINVLALTVPLHMMHVYDHVLTSRSGPTLFFLGLLACGLLLSLGALEMFRSRILVRLGTQFDQALRGKVFSAAIADRLQGRSDAAQAPRDLEILRAFLSGGALPIIFDAPWAPIFIAVTFLLHPLLGLVAMVGAIVLVSVALLNELATRQLTRSGSASLLTANTYFESSLRNAEAITAMGMAPGIIGRWMQWHDTAMKRFAHVADRSGDFSAVAKFWRPFLQVAMLSVGAWLAIDQIITPGIMIASSIIMGRALAPVEGAIATWRNLLGARGAYARLHALLDRQEEQAHGMSLPPPKGQLTVSGLVATPSRALGRPVLRGVSFALEAGESLGIVGPSAAGKSTLARCLVGILPPLSGEVRLDNALLTQWDRDSLGASIGYLPQDIELFEGTVADNIARFSSAGTEAVINAACLAGVHEMILHLPQGYDTRIGTGGEALSAGQRQRIGLARALLGRPALVVLDEPNSNLDSDGEDELRASLLKLKEFGSTVIVIAHRPNIIAITDKVLLLRDGAVEMFGNRADVLGRITRSVPRPPVQVALSEAVSQ